MDIKLVEKYCSEIEGLGDLVSFSLHHCITCSDEEHIEWEAREAYIKRSEEILNEEYFDITPLENELKYELTDETREYEGHTLHRIKALKDFDCVKKGALGGWIESEENLSQYGNAWIAGNAMVYEGGSVWGNARVCNNAKVFGHALICVDAQVCDEAVVCGGATVCGYANINMNTRIEGNVTIGRTPSFFS